MDDPRDIEVNRGKRRSGESKMTSMVPGEAGDGVFTIEGDDPPRLPLVFTSPHSGCDYQESFLARARLDLLTLRQSEDAFVDQLFAGVPARGAVLLKATFPRVFVDPNREPYELDSAMFRVPLPEYVNTTSARVAAGLGTVPRIVATGDEIYGDKLEFGEVAHRIERFYFPFHRALERILERTFSRFGCYLLIDCHSMPSVAAAFEADAGSWRADFVLGDCFGTACAPQVTNRVEDLLRGLGYSVRRNVPYAGGHITRFYSRPALGRHTLQIEINRGLYMDERQVRPNGGFATLSGHIERLTESLSLLDPAVLAPVGAAP
jgi:N-formylglutamate amidohydrolase